MYCVECICCKWANCSRTTSQIYIIYRSPCKFNVLSCLCRSIDRVGARLKLHFRLKLALVLAYTEFLWFDKNKIKKDKWKQKKPLYSYTTKCESKRSNKNNKKNLFCFNPAWRIRKKKLKNFFSVNLSTTHVYCLSYYLQLLLPDKRKVKFNYKNTSNISTIQIYYYTLYTYYYVNKKKETSTKYTVVWLD